jgi:three-Cys-motif partner protein
MGKAIMLEPKYDEIGYWSEIKLDIIKDYAAAYSRILSSQKKPSLYHIYIDAFAGAGKHISKKTGTFVLGSPMNALLVEPPFREYHFIDLDRQKIASLEEIAGSRQDVQIYHGDCNHVLLEKVLPNAEYKDYRRALCILDPYGLHLNWKVIHTAGQMRSIDIFLNFPVADMNRMEKVSNEKVAEAFRKRLNKVAGFRNVPEPIAMRNTQNAVVYYLFFASHKLVAEDIIKFIFDKYRDRRA